MEEESVDYINDNVYGRIELTRLEEDIVATPTFQRLGRIQQLGLASMLFPGATHTRLVHSLGVLHVMTQVTKQLNFDKEETKKLRLAALLHDIGQYPLSHAIEFVYRRIGKVPEVINFLFKHPENINQYPEDISSSLKRAAFSPNIFSQDSADAAKDKQIAGEVIKRRRDLQDVFRKHDIGENFIGEVIDIIGGKHPTMLYKQLMDSDYDCDRLDYVTRDAAMAGVQYGLIDLKYLIENLITRPDPPKSTNRLLAVRKQKALHTLEHYLTARYYMYSQITHHKTIKSLDLIAKAIFLELAQRKDGNIYRSYKEIVDIINTDEFLVFDDTYFFKKIFEYYSQADAGDPIKDLIRRILHKRPFTTVRECKTLFLHEQKRPINDEYSPLRNHLTNDVNLTSLCDDVGIQPGDVIVEEIPVEFVPIGPVVSYTEALTEKKSEVIRSSPRLFNEAVDQGEGKIEYLLNDPSTILRELSRSKLYIFRVLLTIDDEDVHSKFLKALGKRIK